MLFIFLILFFSTWINSSDHPLLMLCLWDLLSVTNIIYYGPIEINKNTPFLSSLLIVKELSLIISIIIDYNIGVFFSLVANLSFVPFILIPVISSNHVVLLNSKEIPISNKFNIILYNILSKCILLFLSTHFLFYDSLLLNIYNLIFISLITYIISFIFNNIRFWIKGVSNESTSVILILLVPGITLWLFITILLISIIISGSSIIPISQFSPIGHPQWLIKFNIGSELLSIFPIYIIIMSIFNQKLILSIKIN